VGEHLGNRGWTDADIQAVTWQNFHRVAEQAWQPTAL
jgi:microsomal dipeptidase-like Zn-dependent dipeptidase